MASTKKPDFWEGFEAIKDRNWTIQKKWPMLWDLGVIGQHLFSMRTSQLDKNSLKSNKSFKRHPNKKKTQTPLKLSPVTKPTRDAPWCVFAKKALRNLNRHALANPWLVECRNDGLWKTRFKKKKQPRRSEVRKFPLKLIQPLVLFQVLVGQKDSFCFLKHQP